MVFILIFKLKKKYDGRPIRAPKSVPILIKKYWVKKSIRNSKIDLNHKNKSNFNLIKK